MMKLWKIIWIIRSPILSPMTSDVILGIYAWAYREVYGQLALEEWLCSFHDSPPMVFSDAWESGTLPRPMMYKRPDFSMKTKQDRLLAARAGKREKRSHVVSVQDFYQMVSGEYEPRLDSSIQAAPYTLDLTHTTINRQTGGPMDGQLYTVTGWTTDRSLEIYCHTDDIELLQELSRIVAYTGIGGGISRGYGQIDLHSIEPFAWPTIENANAEVWLGHGIPAATYSTRGKYRIQVKYGKVANGLWDTTPWKYPFILFNPGSTFEVDHWNGYVGSVIKGVAEKQEVRQLAFTVTVPACVSVKGLDEYEEGTV